MSQAIRKCKLACVRSIVPRKKNTQKVVKGSFGHELLGHCNTALVLIPTRFLEFTMTYNAMEALRLVFDVLGSLSMNVFERRMRLLAFFGNSFATIKRRISTCKTADLQQ